MARIESLGASSGPFENDPTPLVSWDLINFGLAKLPRSFSCQCALMGLKSSIFGNSILNDSVVLLSLTRVGGQKMAIGTM